MNRMEEISFFLSNTQINNYKRELAQSYKPEE